MLELRWRGPVLGQSGYELLTRNILVALDKLGIKIELMQAPEWNPERISLPFSIGDRLYRMMNTRVRPSAPLVMHQKYWDDADRFPGSKYVYTLFETDKVPEPWRQGLLRCHKLFLFSNWNLREWMKDDMPANQLVNIGQAIDMKLFNPEKVKPAKITNQRGYTFLANGDFIERKNWDLLIEAYCKEFKASEEVTLIIKTHHGGFIKTHKEYVYSEIRKRAKQWSTRPPRILVMCDKLSEEEVPKLYASAHCYVLPSRGEGLGLPYLEAMAMGLPVISTNWGGQTDFIKDQYVYGRKNTGLFVESDIRLITDVEYIKKCPHAVGHSWAEANLDQLRKAMRWCFENRKEADEMGQRGREVAQKLTYQKMALKLLRGIFEPVNSSPEQGRQMAGSVHHG